MTNTGANLKAAREAKQLPLIEAWAQYRERTPESHRVSMSTIQRAENDGPIDSLTIAILSQVYGCKVADISETAAAELQELRDVLAYVGQTVSAGEAIDSFPLAA